MKKFKAFIQIPIIIIFILLQNFSLAEEKKFKIIAEAIPIRSFYEVVEPDKKQANKPKETTETQEKPKIVGSDIEIISKIFNKINIPFEIELVHWNQLQSKIKNGETDMILGITKKSKYAPYVHFTRLPSYSKTYSFYAFADKVKEKTVMTYENAVAHNYTVGIRVGFKYPKEFWDGYPFQDRVMNNHLYEFRSYKDCINKLKQKKIDLCLADRERTNPLIKKLGDEENIFQYKNVLYWLDFYFAFSKKSKYPNLDKIKSQVDRELYKMTEQEELAEINLTWINKGL
ncbi:MAG: hypothetical protein DCC88_08915 [Spirobacillus cienkowskii]|uniref:Solute-binding protein family 3/N-terminal domain-containing protein n=1 Tax=Spirobacillus cienkowskii TaxID=495820 RepID=A0A369KQL1_9BACT|nr:MAG: hypothetical protein DCC88_08915 [Spirobacillus cienkowskii]